MRFLQGNYQEIATLVLRQEIRGRRVKDVIKIA